MVDDIGVVVIIGTAAEEFVSVSNEYHALSMINGLYFLKLTGLAIKSMVICLSIYLIK